MKEEKKPPKTYTYTQYQTGGARGLGLSLATGIADAGGTVHCLDRLPQSDASFSLAQRSIHPASPGSLHYAQVDVTDAASLNDLVASIAEKHGRMDGCVAAAGIQRICPALDYGMKEAREMLDTNLLGVLNTACAVARQAYRFPPPPLPPLSGLPASSSSSSEESNVSHASIVLIASMSGMIANKGLICPIYNASKAGVTQLARNLAMEWGKPQLYPGTPQHLEDLASPPLELLETVSSSSSSRGTAGRGGRRAKPRVSIRVNALSPGHIITPMVERNFEEVPGLREIWEKESMLGRLSRPEEFRGAAVFLLSRASSYMVSACCFAVVVAVSVMMMMVRVYADSLCFLDVDWLELDHRCWTYVLVGECHYMKR